jgi:hypothetical protein
MSSSRLRQARVGDRRELAQPDPRPGERDGVNEAPRGLAQPRARPLRWCLALRDTYVHGLRRTVTSVATVLARIGRPRRSWRA